MNVIDFIILERDMQTSHRDPRERDCAEKPGSTFPHPALDEDESNSRESSTKRSRVCLGIGAFSPSENRAAPADRDVNMRQYFRRERGEENRCRFSGPVAFARMAVTCLPSRSRLLQKITVMTSISIFRNIELEMDRFDLKSSGSRGASGF
jgi:hypothetical protein